MENKLVSYIELIDNDTQERVILAVDTAYHDTVYELILRQLDSQSDREDYKSFTEYVEDIISVLACEIVDIDTTIVVG